MAKYQRTAKAASEKQAGQAVGQDAKQPRVFTGQTKMPKALLDEMLRRMAAPLGDSEDYMIVAPSGKFYKVPGISQDGGTDVERP